MDLLSAEKIWRALGATEVVLQKRIEELAGRIRDLRAMGDADLANLLADARAEIQMELKSVTVEAEKAQLRYFALVRKQQRVR